MIVTIFQTEPEDAIVEGPQVQRLTKSVNFICASLLSKAIGGSLICLDDSEKSVQRVKHTLKIPLLMKKYTETRRGQHLSPLDFQIYGLSSQSRKSSVSLNSYSQSLNGFEMNSSFKSSVPKNLNLRLQLSMSRLSHKKSTDDERKQEQQHIKQVWHEVQSYLNEPVKDHNKIIDALVKSTKAIV